MSKQAFILASTLMALVAPWSAGAAEPGSRVASPSYDLKARDICILANCPEGLSPKVLKYFTDLLATWAEDRRLTEVELNKRLISAYAGVEMAKRELDEVKGQVTAVNNALTTSEVELQRVTRERDGYKKKAQKALKYYAELLVLRQVRIAQLEEELTSGRRHLDKASAAAAVRPDDPLLADLVRDLANGNDSIERCLRADREALAGLNLSELNRFEDLLD